MRFFIKLIRVLGGLYHFIMGLCIFFVGFSYHKKGQLDRAIEKYRIAIRKNKKILELIPNHIGFSVVHLQLGKIYICQNKFDLAIEEFKKAISIDGKDPYPHICLGFVYDKQGKISLAIEEYKKAILIQPDDPYIHNNLGLAYHNQGNLNLAVEEYKKALGNSSYDTPEFAHNNLGLTYYQQGQYSLAVEEYEKAIKFSHDNPAIYCNMAEAYRSMGKHSIAIKHFKDALNIDPVDLPSLVGLGKVYQDNCTLPADVFQKECENILLKHPADPKIYLNIGITYLELGDTEDAIEKIENAINIDPDFALAHNTLGIIYAEQKNFEEAILYCEHALQLDKSLYQAYYTLGNIYEEKGEPDKAVFYYEQFLKFDNDCDEVYERLGEVYMELGQHENSQRAFGQVKNLSSQNSCYQYFSIVEQEFPSDKIKIDYTPNDNFNDIDIKKHIEMIEDELRFRCG